MALMALQGPLQPNPLALATLVGEYSLPNTLASDASTPETALDAPPADFNDIQNVVRDVFQTAIDLNVKRDGILAKVRAAREELAKKDAKCATELSADNIRIRNSFASWTSYVSGMNVTFPFNHILATDAVIKCIDDPQYRLYNPQRSKMRDAIVVFGAQTYEIGSKTRCLEPLDYLLSTLKPSGKLFLVDYDPKSLASLSQYLKEDRRVVTVVQDVTGICRKVQDLIERRFSTPNDFFDAITALFEKEQKEIELSLKTQYQAFSFIENERADLVVSSLVASQLPLVIRDLVSAHLKVVHKQNDSMLAKNERFHKFRLAQETLGRTLIAKHIKDLFDLCIPAGNVYFADTLGNQFHCLWHGRIEEQISSTKFLLKRLTP